MTKELVEGQSVEADFATLRRPFFPPPPSTTVTNQDWRQKFIKISFGRNGSEGHRLDSPFKDIYVSGIFVFVLADMIPMAITTAQFC